MSRPRPIVPPRSRLLRGAAVGAVLVGYLGVLMGTSIGQGWGHLAHVATETHAVLEAPRLQADPLLAPAPGMTTLRAPEHSHGAHTHRHSSSALPEAGRHVRTGAPAREAPRSETFHAHGGEVHSHDLPPTEEAPVATLALDDHRLPPADGLAAPRPRDSPRLGDSTGQLASVSISVETPPPRV